MFHTGFIASGGRLSNISANRALSATRVAALSAEFARQSVLGAAVIKAVIPCHFSLSRTTGHILRSNLRSDTIKRG